MISYLNSLPPGDEFRKLTELLGLLSLLGQRVPEAVAELLGELRAQARAASEYHAQVDGRLTALPQEIAASVDINAIAEGMTESFRQQLALTGLATTANLLQNSSREITAAIRSDFSLTQAGRSGIPKCFSQDLQRTSQTHDGFRRTPETQRSTYGGGTLEPLVGAGFYDAGAFFGRFHKPEFMRRRGQTTNALMNLGAQVERIQTPAAVPLAVPTAKKVGKQSAGKR